MVEDAELEDDPQVQKLVQAASATGSKALTRNLRRLLAVKISEQQVYPFDEGSFPEDGLELGVTNSGRSLTLKAEELTRHLLAVGQSGSGKTTLFYNLMQQLDVPFWSFDLKQDYRHLSRDLDLLVLPWTRLRFNPLRPPCGVSPKRWAQVFSEIFGHATALLSGSKNHLLKSVIELYKLYHLFDGVEPPYPSTHELQMLIGDDSMNYMRKQSDYRDTLLNRFEAMNMVAGEIFDCSTGYRPEDLLDRNVVFEFDGLNRDVQNFLMEILFAYVYEYRVAQNHRDTGLNHVFFLDEGKRVFSMYKERQDASGIPEIDELTAKMREFGEGLVVADQEASKLTDSIKANTYTKLLLSTGDRKQFQAVANSMNLSERQAEFAQSLDVGEAIIQSGNHSPVPVKLDEVQVDKSISDHELQRMQAGKWSQLQHEPTEHTDRLNRRLAHGGSEEVDEREVVDDPAGEVDVSADGDKLLRDIVDDPFRSLTARYDAFSSSYKGNKAKNELVDAGVVVERNVRTGQSKRKLLQLTEKGRKYAENELDLRIEQRGRGGVVHQYWQHQVREAFESRGWHVEIENYDADVYAQLKDTELVVEVAMGNNPREIQHVDKHMDRFDAVWVACRNQEVLDGLRQRMKENDLLSESVVFRLVRDFNEGELPAV